MPKPKLFFKCLGCVRYMPLYTYTHTHTQRERERERERERLPLYTYRHCLGYLVA